MLPCKTPSFIKYRSKVSEAIQGKELHPPLHNSQQLYLYIYIYIYIVAYIAPHNYLLVRLASLRYFGINDMVPSIKEVEYF